VGQPLLLFLLLLFLLLLFLLLLLILVLLMLVLLILRFLLLVLLCYCPVSCTDRAAPKKEAEGARNKPVATREWDAITTKC